MTFLNLDMAILYRLRWHGPDTSPNLAGFFQETPHRIRQRLNRLHAEQRVTRRPLHDRPGWPWLWAHPDDPTMTGDPSWSIS